MRATRHLSSRSGGFTFVELLVSSLLVAVALAAGYTLLNSALILYAKNVSLNRSHHTGRMSLEKMMLKINGAGAAPILVDDKGADVPGDGPAAGIRFCTPIATGVYEITNTVAATDSTLTLRVNSSQLLPRASDIILVDAGTVVLNGAVVQVEIASVSGSTTPVTVTLRNPAGSAIPAGTRCLILQQMSFICRDNALRFYPMIMSESRHGATAFNQTQNYTIVSNLEPNPGDPSPLPFAYKDASRRILRVTLRNRTGQYMHRIAPFNTFFSIRSSIAVRSPFLNPAKLGPIE